MLWLNTLLRSIFVYSRFSVLMPVFGVLFWIPSTMMEDRDLETAVVERIVTSVEDFEADTAAIEDE